ncbi:alpha/beta hydrolase [Mycobacterium szulgai]|uniref:Alpha/beta hydrolase n=3 Tax=Mycobacteriaceae TaxID=1762 RepID=A0A1W9ZWD8_MYCAN|nr:alpha/beta hydrolase [Mycobacterium szulgai]MCV7198311.1 alpha/beta hydrolase [Mycobacterium angelicum]ORA21968.1 alpha/beta hydrolase [Mycobacterium angelicum]ORX12969.1 alpha/beta hydrolase [Mycobacterium szulgai]
MVRAGVLKVALEQYGDPGGWPAVLLHGFPYDVRCYDQVAPRLVAVGAYVVVPYLRGYGATRFIDPAVMRSGQQAALAADLYELIGALGLRAPVVAGFDWGGRAACVTAALWPQLVRALVSVSGYNLQDISAMASPAAPESERRLWYQYYLHGERGRAGLQVRRREFARLLWQEWSPRWSFTDDEFATTATSFDNPDFVDVVVHSYRHRYGLAAGDPAYQHLEDTISTQPPIAVPTVVIDPQDDPLVGSAPPRSERERRFPALLDVVSVASGHNVPQENPEAFAAAILHAHRRS